MKKVYADRSLPYTQDAKFTFPADVNLCEKEYYGVTDDVDNNAEEASFEGVFD